MKTKDIFPVLPYFYESKLNMIEDDLNQKIFDLVSTDNLKDKIFKSFTKSDDYNSSRRKYDIKKNELIDRLYSVKAKYIAQEEQLLHLKHDYINLIAIEGDSNLLLFNEQNNFIEKINTQSVYKENINKYKQGIVAHQNALADEIKLHNAQVEHLKSVHYKNTADNIGVSIDVIKSKNADIRKDGFLNGEDTLKKIDTTSQEQTTLPSYPSQPQINIESTVSNPSQELINTPLERKEESSEAIEIANTVFSKEVKFTPSKELPDYIRGELELLQSTHIYGEKYQQVHFGNQEQNEELIQIPSSAKDVIHIPKVQTNILSRTSLKNCLVLIFCIIAAMVVEYLVFRSILTSIFKFSDYKSIASGLVIVVLSEVLAFILRGVVKNFILKLNALRWKIYASRFFIALFVAIIFYTASVGLIFSHNNARASEITDYQLLLSEKENLENQYEINPTTQTKNEIEKLDAKITDNEKEIHHENGFVKAVKALIIVLSSSIMILVNAVLLNVTLLFLLSYSLLKKIQYKSSGITKLEASFFSTHNKLHDLKRSFAYLTNLLGQRIFIRKLKSGATPTNAHYNPDSKTILPLE